MSWCLWVDDEHPSFPAVDRMCRRHVGRVETASSIAEGQAWLARTEDHPPTLVLLDLILPRGMAHHELGVVDPLEFVKDQPYARYAGLRLIERYPSLRDRFVVLSMVSRTELDKAGLPASIPTFSKLHLNSQLDRFKQLLDRLAARQE